MKCAAKHCAAVPRAGLRAPVTCCIVAVTQHIGLSRSRAHRLARGGTTRAPCTCCCCGCLRCAAPCGPPSAAPPRPRHGRTPQHTPAAAEEDYLRAPCTATCSSVAEPMCAFCSSLRHCWITSRMNARASVSACTRAHTDTQRAHRRTGRAGELRAGAGDAARATHVADGAREARRHVLAVRDVGDGPRVEGDDVAADAVDAALQLLQRARDAVDLEQIRVRQPASRVSAER